MAGCGNGGVSLILWLMLFIVSVCCLFGLLYLMGLPFSSSSLGRHSLTWPF